MPWKISEQNGAFCVVRKSDGKVVKCHDTRKEANSHIAALYVNEPSAAKKSVGYGMLKSLIAERVEELKGCGANKPGGGGFTAGNSCAGGKKTGYQSASDKAKDLGDAAHNTSGTLLERSKRSDKAAKAHYAAEKVAPSADLRTFHGEQAIMFETASRNLLDRYYKKR